MLFWNDFVNHAIEKYGWYFSVNVLGSELYLEGIINFIVSMLIL